MEWQETSNIHHNPEKEEQRQRYHTFWLQPILQNYGIKIDINQWNRMKSSELIPQKYGQQIFNKGAKNTQRGKDSLFNKWCWENWIHINRTMKLDLILYHILKLDQGLKYKTWYHKTPRRKLREEASQHGSWQ